MLLARLAEIAATVVPDTATVVTVNVVEVVPPAIETVEGTVALVEFEVRLIVTPPDGAALESVTVPVDVPPPRTDVGARVTDAIDGGLTVRVAVFVDPAVDAEMVTEVAVATPLVVIGKVALDAPCATVTDDATLAAVLLDERVTTMPPVPAGVTRVTVPVED